MGQRRVKIKFSGFTYWYGLVQEQSGSRLQLQHGDGLGFYSDWGRKRDIFLLFIVNTKPGRKRITSAHNMTPWL